MDILVRSICRSANKQYRCCSEGVESYAGVWMVAREARLELCKAEEIWEASECSGRAEIKVVVETCLVLLEKMKEQSIIRKWILHRHSEGFGALAGVPSDLCLLLLFLFMWIMLVCKNQPKRGVQVCQALYRHKSRGQSLPCKSNTINREDAGWRKEVHQAERTSNSLVVSQVDFLEGVG